MVGVKLIDGFKCESDECEIVVVEKLRKWDICLSVAGKKIVTLYIKKKRINTPEFVKVFNYGLGIFGFAVEKE